MNLKLANEILSKYSSKDWSLLENSILCSYNKHGNLFRLFIEVRDKKYIPTVAEFLELKFLDISRKRCLNLMSKLYEEIENQIVFQELSKERHLRRLYLHKFYLNNGYELNARSIREKLLKKESSLGIEESFLIFQILNQEYFSNSQLKYESGNSLLHEAEAKLDEIRSKIRLVYEIERLNRSRLEFGEDRKAIKLLESQSSKKQNIILDRLLLMMKGDMTFEFDRLYEELVNDESLISTEFVNLFSFLHCIQYCVREIKKGNIEQHDRLLKLYEIGLDRKLFLNNGVLPYRNLGNVIEAFCASDQHQKAKDILDNNIKFIQTDLKREVLIISNAQILFSKKDYQSTLEIIEEIQFLNLDSKLRYRWYKASCLFELRRVDELLNFLDSTAIFFRRHKGKFTKATIEGTLNYLKVIRLLLGDSNAIKIKQILKDNKNVVFRTWINSKLD